MNHEVGEVQEKPVRRGPVDGIVKERKWWFAIPPAVWVVAAFFIASLTVGVIVDILSGIGINLKNFDQNIVLTFASAAIYIVLLLLTLGAPRILRLWSSRISYRRLIGLTRLLQWRDILFAAIAFVVYLVLGIGLVLLVSAIIPGFNPQQAQDTGFSKTLTPNNAILVFFALVVVAPVAEEIIFRGYLFGTLRRTVPVWVAALITSALFGAIHGQWNVGVDVFVMSLVSCFLRYKTGSIWASMLLHMCKNGLAFYTLYIATSSIM